MKYYCGPTECFDPPPSGEVYSESSDESIQIWKASSYTSSHVSEVTKEIADMIITRPAWNGE